ncbi:FeoA family protein [Salinispira pacifica]|uniref:Ferrous iron transporter FeoA-like domain-containing protein n=1 Tax=Salinispira pacifica TaxID=1307761 RepID=V5WE09_9SPIO|nr:FeoA family protein [Salinispira pacifica]AHC14007.1 hypothetical protein L21SP2_0575 [Salinispira pacifica]
MTLANASANSTYIISSVQPAEAGMKDFLFTLGCYPGEKVTVISRLSGNHIINVKNARYSLDDRLAAAIHITSESAKSALDSALKVG